jgi:hypothetical protein
VVGGATATALRGALRAFFARGRATLAAPQLANAGHLCLTTASGMPLAPLQPPPSSSSTCWCETSRNDSMSLLVARDVFLTVGRVSSSQLHRGGGGGGTRLSIHGAPSGPTASKYVAASTRSSGVMSSTFSTATPRTVLSLWVDSTNACMQETEIGFTW